MSVHEPTASSPGTHRASRLLPHSHTFDPVQPGPSGDRSERRMSQPDRLLSWPQVRACCGGLGRTTIWKLRVAGEFPSPVALSPGRVAWRERDIETWLASRVEVAV